MVILEWTRPGVWIEGLDKDAAWRISGQIEQLEDAILEANVTLNMFDQARSSDQTMESHEDEFDVRSRIYREVEAELFPDGVMPMGMRNDEFRVEYDKRRVRVDIEVRHQMWRRGFLPRSFLFKPPFIFAKAFIHALDLFDKFLSDIAKDPDAHTQRGLLDPLIQASVFKARFVEPCHSVELLRLPLHVFRGLSLSRKSLLVCLAMNVLV